MNHKATPPQWDGEERRSTPRDAKECAMADTLDLHAEKIGELDEKIESVVKAFLPELRGHIKEEEENKKHFMQLLDSGDARMDRIESDLSSLNKLVDMFEGFGKSMKIVIVLGGCVLSLFLYLLLEKSNDMKSMQEIQIKHSIALERMLASHQELERDFRRDIGRVENAIGGLYPRANREQAR